MEDLRARVEREGFSKEIIAVLRDRYIEATDYHLRIAYIFDLAYFLERVLSKEELIGKEEDFEYLRHLSDLELFDEVDFLFADTISWGDDFYKDDFLEELLRTKGIFQKDLSC